MNRYLGPWACDGGDKFYRVRIHDDWKRAGVYSHDEPNMHAYGRFKGWAYAYFGAGMYGSNLYAITSVDDNGTGTVFSTKEEAMEACDKLLVESGYELLTEERAEKLMLLL